MKTMVLGLSSPLGRKTSFSINSLTQPLLCLCHYAPVHSFASSLRENNSSLKNKQKHGQDIHLGSVSLFFHFLQELVSSSISSNYLFILLLMFPLCLIQLTPHWGEFTVFSLALEIRGWGLLFYILPTHTVPHPVILNFFLLFYHNSS